jgi:hypothetical protein
LHALGFTATEVAEVLKDEFSLIEQETAQILLDDGYWLFDVAAALRDAFSADPLKTAQVLKALAYSAQETYDVLTQVYGIQDVIFAEQILYNAGYLPEEYLEFTAIATIRRFAPILGIDRAYRGLPMSADDYFFRMMRSEVDEDLREVTWLPRTDGPTELCGRDECNRGMQNTDFGLLILGAVPTYFKVISDVATGRLRIAYWWYYGFQSPCNFLPEGPDGTHHGDWEHIVVTTNPDRSSIDAVSFFQHGGYYTMLPGSYSSSGDRPLVFVGKIAHGSYHDRCHAPECKEVVSALLCRYFYDFRNPDDSWGWWDTSNNLVSLRGNWESWMEPDHIGSTIIISNADYTITHWQWGPDIDYCNVWVLWCWDWNTTTACGTHPTVSDLTWTMAHCADDGCDRSQGWPASLSVSQESIAIAAEEVARSPAISGAPVTTADRQNIIEALSEVLAATLGMSVEEVKAANGLGLTICEIAESRGLDLAVLWRGTSGLRELILQQAVEEGWLSQAQADWIKGRLADHDPSQNCLGGK